MSDKQAEEEILELIRLIDGNKSKLFRPYDLFYGWSSLFFVIVVLYIFIEPIAIFYFVRQ